MKLLATCCVMLVALGSICQISEANKKKINKIIGAEYKELKPQQNYPFREICEGCQVDSFAFRKFEITGVHYDNQYVMYQSPNSFKEGREKAKLISLYDVTIAEYQEFENYVRDSIARDKLFFGLEEDGDAENYLFVDENLVFKNRFGKLIVYDRSDRSDNRSYYRLNWRTKFKYDDPELVPILADMYLPSLDRIHRLKVFDKRKYVYSYSDTYESFESLSDEEKERIAPDSVRCESSPVFNLRAPIMANKFAWSERSEHPFDTFSALSRLSSNLIKDSGITGIEGFQANAFCHWKAEQIQKEFDDAELPYQVVVTLPMKEDLLELDRPVSRLTLDEYDYTEQWRITNIDYQKFMDHVRDSMLRQHLFFNLNQDEDAEKFIHHPGYYPAEGGLEYVEYERSDRDINRYYSTLNYKAKINLKNNEVKKLVSELDREINQKGYNYNFSYVESMQLAETGYYSPYVKRRNWSIDTWGLVGDSSNQILANKNHILGYVNCAGVCTRVNTYRTLYPFINHFQINVRPKSKIRIPENENLIQNITYEQAIAFYHWKYPIQFADEESDWHEFVYPSKEEFEKIKNGQMIKTRTRSVPYPMPTFRYVVHLYKK